MWKCFSRGYSFEARIFIYFVNSKGVCVKVFWKLQLCKCTLHHSFKKLNAIILVVDLGHRSLVLPLENFTFGFGQLSFLETKCCLILQHFPHKTIQEHLISYDFGLYFKKQKYWAHAFLYILHLFQVQANDTKFLAPPTLGFYMKSSF